MMARHELRERRLIAHRGRSHDLGALDRHRVHHAIEIRLGAGLIQEVYEYGRARGVESAGGLSDLGALAGGVAAVSTREDSGLRARIRSY